MAKYYLQYAQNFKAKEFTKFMANKFDARKKAKIWAIIRFFYLGIHDFQM